MEVVGLAVAVPASCSRWDAATQGTEQDEDSEGRHTGLEGRPAVPIGIHAVVLRVEAPPLVVIPAIRCVVHLRGPLDPTWDPVYKGLPMTPVAVLAVAPVPLVNSAWATDTDGADTGLLVLVAFVVDAARVSGGGVDGAKHDDDGDELQHHDDSHAPLEARHVTFARLVATHNPRRAGDGDDHAEQRQERA